MKKILQSQFGARNRRLKKEGISYKEYLMSARWVNIRKQLKSFPEFKMCYCCGKLKGLEMHHKTYRYIFSEKLRHHRDNIIALCRKCHQETHDLSVENSWGLKQAARRLRKMNCI